jgi:hypothetical protein
MRPHIRAVVVKLVPAMFVSSTAASIPAAITVGSIKRASMCCRVALATLTAASTMLSATSAASTALRGDGGRVADRPAPVFNRASPRFLDRFDLDIVSTTEN